MKNKMGGVEKERGVLKLVHPGRYVEIHREPIKASEVLKKNPRHSVTRPDVFEYPWIVVRPESTLNLGKVFYIVPNTTIYKLIKSKGYSIQPSSQQSHSPQRYVHRQLLEKTSPVGESSSAGRTPKHHEYCRDDWQQFQATGCEMASPQEQAGNNRFNRPPQCQSLADMMAMYQSTYKEFRHMSMTDSASDVESPDYKEYKFREVNCSKAPAALGNAGKEEVTILKPCLRKHDSARKLLLLKVSFSLPNECEEKIREKIDFRVESPSFFAC